MRAKILHKRANFLESSVSQVFGQATWERWISRPCVAAMGEQIADGAERLR
jgi:hypothetical protein